MASERCGRVLDLRGVGIVRVDRDVPDLRLSRVHVAARGPLRRHRGVAGRINEIRSNWKPTHDSNLFQVIRTSTCLLIRLIAGTSIPLGAG